MVTGQQQQNWAGNYTYRAGRMLAPRSVAELQEAVRGSDVVHALGTRHSFNHIADTAGTLISLEHFDHLVSLDADRRTVTIESGVTYGHLCEYLDRAGFALHNLASLPHISVVGACMTASHGSGLESGSLATAVRALEFVTADGELVQRSRDEHPDEFPGLVVGLGGYGIVTKITLDLLPRFDMRQYVYLDMPFARVEEHLDAIQGGAYSVSLFTRWQGDHFDQVWLKYMADDARAADMPERFYDAHRAPAPVTPVGDAHVERCTGQMGVPGPWYDRLPHFRMHFTPSHGEELQTEYYIPREHAVDALRAVRALKAEITPLLHISEVRCVAADDHWMSPAYQRPGVTIHFTWKKQPGPVSALLPRIEAALAPFDARPHWGKVFTMPLAQVGRSYPRLPDFRDLLERRDPQGKFRNAFLEALVFGA